MSLPYPNPHCLVYYSSTIVIWLIIVVDIDWLSAQTMCLDYPTIVYICHMPSPPVQKIHPYGATYYPLTFMIGLSFMIAILFTTYLCNSDITI